MDKTNRRVWIGAFIGAAACIIALVFASVGSDAGARGGKRAKSSKRVIAKGSKAVLYSCQNDFGKRPVGAKLLQKDFLNSGAWMIGGVDPLKSPRITIWSCRRGVIEPSGQLRPYWRKRQQPPLGPPPEFDVCEPVTVTRISKNRIWFACNDATTIHIRMN